MSADQQLRGTLPTPSSHVVIFSAINDKHLGESQQMVLTAGSDCTEPGLVQPGSQPCPGSPLSWLGACSTEAFSCWVAIACIV